MSCDACESMQDPIEAVFPYRLGTATILIVACREHASQAIGLLNKAQRELRNATEPDPASARDKDPG